MYVVDKAVFWFVLDEGQKIVRVLAVFFGAQDHIRHMLVRLLDDRPNALNSLQPCGLGQIHPESVSITLIPPGHLW